MSCSARNQRRRHYRAEQRKEETRLSMWLGLTERAVPKRDLTNRQKAQRAKYPRAVQMVEVHPNGGQPYTIRKVLK